MPQRRGLLIETGDLWTWSLWAMAAGVVVGFGVGVIVGLQW